MANSFTLGIAELGTEVNLDGLDDGLSRAKKKGSAFSLDVGNILSTGLGVLTGGALLGGVQALTNGLGKFFGVVEQKQKALAQLDAVLTSTKNAAGLTRDEIVSLAGSFEFTTAFTEETVLEASNLLLTFTAIGEDVFPDVIATALDMSQALGQDTKASVMQLGKALQDPIAGVSALRKVGVNFNEEAMTTIKRLVAMGDVAGAQKLILAELNTEFGGSAEAVGKTLPVQLMILQRAFDEIGESVATFFLPLVLPMLTTLTKWAVDTLPALGEGVIAWRDALMFLYDDGIKQGLGPIQAFARVVENLFGADAANLIEDWGLVIQQAFSIFGSALASGQNPLEAFWTTLKLMVAPDVRTTLETLFGDLGNLWDAVADAGVDSSEAREAFQKLFDDTIGKVDWVALGNATLKALGDGLNAAAAATVVAGQGLYDWAVAQVNAVDWTATGNAALAQLQTGLEQAVSLTVSSVKWLEAWVLAQIEATNWTAIGASAYSAIFKLLTDLFGLQTGAAIMAQIVAAGGGLYGWISSMATALQTADWNDVARGVGQAIGTMLRLVFTVALTGPYLISLFVGWLASVDWSTIDWNQIATDFGNGLMAALALIGNLITGVIEGLFGMSAEQMNIQLAIFISDTVTGIESYFASAIVSVVTGATAMGNAIRDGLVGGIAGTMGAIGDLGEGLLAALKLVINSAVDVMNLAIPDSLGFDVLGTPVGISLPANPIPHLRYGTPYFPGGQALVGELGPEVVNLPRGAGVTPMGAGGQSGEVWNVTFGPGSVVIQGNATVETVAQGIDLGIQRARRAMGAA